MPLVGRGFFDDAAVVPSPVDGAAVVVRFEPRRGPPAPPKRFRLGFDSVSGEADSSLASSASSSGALVEGRRRFPPRRVGRVGRGLREASGRLEGALVVVVVVVVVFLLDPEPAGRCGLLRRLPKFFFGVASVVVVVVDGSSVVVVVVVVDVVVEVVDVLVEVVEEDVWWLDKALAAAPATVAPSGIKRAPVRAAIWSGPGAPAAATVMEKL